MADFKNNPMSDKKHHTIASPKHKAEEQTQSESRNADMIDAINQTFALFRRNYHNQYHKAFGDVEELNHVKRLWLEMLGRFTPQAILQGAKSVIENSEYLPTLHTMIYHCEQASSDTAFPDVHAAYLEACRAPSPKANHAWSHLAVYYAGKESDWYFLQTSSESVAYPVFKAKYHDVCAQIRAGKRLAQPERIQIEKQEAPSLDKKTNLSRLEALKASLDFD